MNVLLQGDVGAGKTLVALQAALVAIQSGHQAAIMAPTEVLAGQHLRSVAALLEGVGAHRVPRLARGRRKDDGQGLAARYRAGSPAGRIRDLCAADRRGHGKDRDARRARGSPTARST